MRRNTNFSHNAPPPGYHAGIGTKSGDIIWGSDKKMPGWKCQKEQEHFDTV